jgi:ribosome biogenesis protein BRX1
MNELRLTGNCLKGSRFIVSFDAAFDEQPHLKMIKQLLEDAFSVPKSSRKVKPFIDHVISFSVLDNRVWFRHYQIIEKDGSKTKQEDLSLVEIGPRFVMNPVRIFGGSFGGPTVWENTEFVPPTEIRREIMRTKQAKRVAKLKERDRDMDLPEDLVDNVFHE